MPVTPELLELLACPVCHGSLHADAERPALLCPSCGLRYPIKDDIPILLPEQAERLQPADGAPDAAPPAA
ncbi:MAG TPA: Trm112 family protein [Candidatus Avidesulfovibrio excrementigallinarum]|nr:Trm112 family protein [Candidatus Avidesulfovibrio excrementigallinarum]